ncbi:MAG: hypothetical protein BWY99_02227 [Synergistetes bacterium ADurb.BinA166]|nr:MAG: hypothetical protein BWY99_02227 [Synergistetes bacterium ADurb.BinA166]
MLTVSGSFIMRDPNFFPDHQTGSISLHREQETVFPTVTSYVEMSFSFPHSQTNDSFLLDLGFRSRGSFIRSLPNF